MGNLLTKTDRKGQKITYSYDNLYRLSTKTYPDSTAVTYSYDALSRLTQAVDPSRTYSFAYDNLGRLTGTTTNYSFLTGRTLTESYRYDAASNRTSFTDPEGGVTNYAYDTLNRLTGLTDFNSNPFAFSYDALGRRTNLTRPNGVNSTNSYDNLSRLLSVLHQSGSSVLDGASYNYDAVGNRTAKTNRLAALPAGDKPTSNFTYDAVYQLTHVTQAPATTENYSYDGVGNRLSSLGAPYAYNISNEMTAAGNATFTYDANGNTTSKTDSSGSTAYTWVANGISSCPPPGDGDPPRRDFENRLTSVTLPNGHVQNYKYDPFGRRVFKDSPTKTRIFVYDGDNVSERLDGSGKVTVRFTQGLGTDEPLEVFGSGASSYYEADGLGSITSLTSASGSVANTYGYDSFGNQTASSGTVSNRFFYTGRENVAKTGLLYYRARYYDPTAGRFLSEDPIKFVAGINFYSYAFNNAPNRQDAYGLDANNWTYGEIRSWAVGPAPGFAPPQGLGDAKASIAAACALNGGGCADVNGATATDAADQAAWRNITQANGTDRSGGGNFMCVGTQGCWFVHKCYECSKGKKILVDRPAALKPSGTVNVGAHTLYFYNDSLQGWCNEKDKNCRCSRK
ncbi:MAG TPA: RHS repeat-associated core domain-containing protein [Terriglobia bacterium]|nr:RHS repeat-associated core domain-containing protein [Terriglobia bacterium]